MTLPELCDNNENQPSTMPVPQEPDSPTNATNSPDKVVDKVGKALLGVLHQAASQGRATCSLMGCVELLSARPDDVMLCVMPALPQADAAATIQSTLIKAVCAEHSIRVLMVDCDIKLAKAVCTETLPCDNKAGVDKNLNQVLKMKTPAVCSEDAPLLISDCDNLAPIMGFPCVLVEFPTDPSAEDELVAQFGKEQLYSGQQKDTYIELPD